jgi:hypothetical protein
MITNIHYPKAKAASLALKLREFRAASEEFLSSEQNPHVNADMREVVRQINWTEYNNVINQLEFCHKQKHKS